MIAVAVSVANGCLYCLVAHGAALRQALAASLSSLNCLTASVLTTASIASSMGSPLRSAWALAWRIKTSLAIWATVWSSRTVPFPSVRNRFRPG